MITRKDLTYYLTATCIFIFLKFLFITFNNDDLLFLLAPTNYLVEILTSSQSVYQSGIGFFHEKINVSIDRSCSGFNFCILCYMMLSFLTLKFCDKTFQRVFIIPAALISAYTLTILANTSRISAAVVLQNQASQFFPADYIPLIHESIGIITYLSFLVITYFVTEQYLINKKEKKNAKLT